MTWESIFWIVGPVALGYGARWWQERTKTDGRDTPIIDTVADAVVRRLGGTPKPADPNQPVSPAPALDELLRLLKQLLSQQQTPAQSNALPTVPNYKVEYQPVVTPVEPK